MLGLVFGAEYVYKTQKYKHTEKGNKENIWSYSYCEILPECMKTGNKSDCDS